MSDYALPLLEWINIPAGEVILEGSLFDVQPFRIARYPVTNEQFDLFIQNQGYKNALWWQDLEQIGGSPRASDWREPDCPKLEAAWFEAVAFCRWLGHELGMDIRLPTEWEWQWAAVGDSGWDYPYGDIFDSAKCNTKESGFGRTNAVTDYVDIQTHFGAVDMSGNVWEWCLNEGASPYNTHVTERENRVMRGGSWNNPQKNANVAFRSSRTPLTRAFNVGFRVIAAS